MQWSQIGLRVAKALGVLAGIAVACIALAAALGHELEVAHAGARKVSCMSNEKQLCLAFLQYTQDNDGMYPSGNALLKTPVASNWKGQGWALQVFPYVKTHNTYDCPCDVVDSMSDPYDDDHNTYECYGNAGLYAVSYAYNSDMASDGAAKVIPGRVIGNAMSQAQIKSASTQVLLSEVYNVCDTFTDTRSNYQSAAAVGSTFFALQNGHEITTTIDSGRHQGGANYAMADGHVLWLRPDKIGAAAGVHQGTCPEAVCEGTYLGN